MELTKDHEQMHLDAQFNMAKMQNYYEWTLSFLQNNLGKRVWDAGAGIGILANIIRKKCDFLLLTEFGDENLILLKKQFSDEKKILVEFCDLQNHENTDFSDLQIETILNMDVIEHLEDELKALRFFYKTLSPGGRLLIKVPAHPFLFCGIDEASLHYRRYTKKMLRKCLEEAGFKIEKIKYMNFIGGFMYFIKGKILRKKVNFSRTMNKGSLSAMNKIIPVFMFLEKIFPVFFGLSVIAVAKKD